MKKFLALLLALCMVLALCACGNTAVAPEAESKPAEAATPAGDAAPVDKYVIGFSIRTITNDNFNKTIADAARAVVEDAGHEFLFVAAGTGETATIEQQAKDIEDLVNKGVDCLIVNPMDQNALLPALQKAKDAGVPVVICSQTIAEGNEDLYVATVSQDLYKSGAGIAECVKECFPDGGDIVIVRGIAGSSAGEDEAQGFIDALEGSNINIVDQQYGEYANDQAMKVTENMIQANPNIVGLFTVSDIMYPGISSALEAAGKTDQVKIFGHDGFKVAADAIRAGYQYSTNMLRPAAVGAQCSEIALMVAERSLPTDYPKFVDMGYTVVTAENVEDFVDSYL